MVTKFVYSEHFFTSPFEFPVYGFFFHQHRLFVKIDDNNITIPYFQEKFGSFITDTDELNLESHIRTMFSFGSLNSIQCIVGELEFPDNKRAPHLEEHTFLDLRRLGSMFDQEAWKIAAVASEILDWDKKTKFCGRCGNDLKFSNKEYGKSCSRCNLIDFPRLSPAVIVAIIKDGQILLAHNNRFPGKMFSILAGFVNPGESLEEAVLREVFEETGISVKNIKYFGSQPWPFPNSLMLGFTAEYDEGSLKPDGTEIQTVGWFTADKLPQIPSKISIARRLIDWYIEKYA